MVKGLVSLVVYDGRVDSPTLGLVNEFKISERNPALIVIPPNLYHGWCNIGIDEALIVNMPSSQYDYEGPDGWTFLTTPNTHRQSSRSVGDPVREIVPLGLRGGSGSPW